MNRSPPHHLRGPTTSNDSRVRGAWSRRRQPAQPHGPISALGLGPGRTRTVVAHRRRPTPGPSSKCNQRSPQRRSTARQPRTRISDKNPWIYSCMNRSRIDTGPLSAVASIGSRIHVVPSASITVTCPFATSCRGSDDDADEADAEQNDVLAAEGPGAGAAVS